MASIYPAIYPYITFSKFDMPPCLKTGDSYSWFNERTCYFKLPIHSRGASLPKRSSFRSGSVLPKRTVESTKEVLVYVLAARLLGF